MIGKFQNGWIEPHNNLLILSSLIINGLNTLFCSRFDVLQILMFFVIIILRHKIFSYLAWKSYLKFLKDKNDIGICINYNN